MFPPYFCFRCRLYGPLDGRFCLIFARKAWQSFLERTNWERGISCATLITLTRWVCQPVHAVWDIYSQLSKRTWSSIVLKITSVGIAGWWSVMSMGIHYTLYLLKAEGLWHVYHHPVACHTASCQGAVEDALASEVAWMGLDSEKSSGVNGLSTDTIVNLCTWYMGVRLVDSEFCCCNVLYVSVCASEHVLTDWKISDMGAVSVSLTTLIPQSHRMKNEGACLAEMLLEGQMATGLWTKMKCHKGQYRSEGHMSRRSVIIIIILY